MLLLKMLRPIPYCRPIVPRRQNHSPANYKPRCYNPVYCRPTCQTGCYYQKQNIPQASSLIIGNITDIAPVLATWWLLDASTHPEESHSHNQIPNHTFNNDSGGDGDGGDCGGD